MSLQYIRVFLHVQRSIQILLVYSPSKLLRYDRAEDEDSTDILTYNCTDTLE